MNYFRNFQKIIKIKLKIIKMGKKLININYKM